MKSITLITTTSLRTKGQLRYAARTACFELLEVRRLLSTTISITANTADQAMRSDGTTDWVGSLTIRSGDNGTGVSEGAAVFPFQLPTLPAGAVVTGAALSVNLQGVANAAQVTGSDDLYGLAARTAPTVLTSDYFEGSYGTDASSTALQQAFAVPTSAAGVISSSTAGNTNLLNYVKAQYTAGAAGKYAILRLNAESDQMVSRYWSWYSADAAAGQKPVLSITYDTLPAAPTNLKPFTTSATSIDLAWTNNAVNATNMIVQRSTDGTNFSTIATLAGTAASYTNGGLPADTKYFYKVYATNSSGDSPATAFVSDTTLPTFSNTIWVDSTFSGTSTGSISAPYTTVAAGLSHAAAGAGVVVRGGTYRESLTMPGGTAANAITLMGEPNERSIVSGMASIGGWVAGTGGIYSTSLTWTPTELFLNNTPKTQAGTNASGFWTAPSVTQDSVAGTTTITDAAHLTGMANLVGATVQMHTNGDNNYHSAVITAQTSTSITFNKITTAANNDIYILRNSLSFLTQTGQWVVVPGTGGASTVYYKPANVSDLLALQAPKQTVGISVRASNVVIRNLEVAGAAGTGINVSGTVGTGPVHVTNVTIKNTTVHSNTGNGIALRYVDHATVSNNVVRANANGITIASTQFATIDSNDVGFNQTDAIDLAGDISARVPGDAGYDPTNNVTVSHNYLHDELGFGHADGLQLYNNVSNCTISSNLITNNCQGLMTEYCDSITLVGNVIFDNDGYNVTFGHGNSTNWTVLNNTIGSGSYGPYLGSAGSTGFVMRENVNVGQSQIGQGYTGDRNLYSSSSSVMISYGGVNYTTVSAFATASGQDAHSVGSNPPGLVNAPVLSRGLADIVNTTTTKLYIGNVTGYAVGDHVEIDHDGIVRTITAIDTTAKAITIDVPLPGKPMSQYLVVADWKANTNYAMDTRLTSASPGYTLGATGSAIGSLINFQQYKAADFNGDGVSDVPTLPADVLAGLPNPEAWQPPTIPGY